MPFCQAVQGENNDDFLCKYSITEIERSMKRVLLIWIIVLSSLSASAQASKTIVPDFTEEYNGVTMYYKIIDPTNRYLRLGSPMGLSWSHYSTLTTIPTTVKHAGVDYTVKVIGIYGGLGGASGTDFYIPEGIEGLTSNSFAATYVQTLHLPSTLKWLDGWALMGTAIRHIVGLENTQITAIPFRLCEQSNKLSQHWVFPPTLRRIADASLAYNITLNDKEITLPEHLDSIAYDPWNPTASTFYSPRYLNRYERVTLLNPNPALMTHRGNDPTHEYYNNSTDMKNLFGTDVLVVNVPVDATHAYETNTDWSYFAGKYREQVNIGATGYTTYYLENENFKVPTGCTAYIITGVTPSGSITTPDNAIVKAFGAGKIIPKQTGFILQGTPNSTVIYQANVTGIEEDVTGNLLVGTATEREISGASYKYYVLSNSGDQGLGFYKQGTRGGASIKLKAHRAGLRLTESIARAKSFFIDFDAARENANVAGIRNIGQEAEGRDNVIYDLQGRRVKNPTHGIYIINGKKVIK